MRKKLSDKTKIDLDLTSLLDVIFIILMIVMCNVYNSSVQNNQKTEELVAHESELQDELGQVQSENELIRQHLEALENADSQVFYITLYADYLPSNPKERHIRLLAGSSTQIDNITITPDTENAAYDDFRAYMTHFLEENSEKPVLLTLDDEQILYRDHVAMEKILDELRENNKNLFISVD